LFFSIKNGNNKKAPMAVTKGALGEVMMGRD